MNFKTLINLKMQSKLPDQIIVAMQIIDYFGEN